MIFAGYSIIRYTLRYSHVAGQTNVNLTHSAWWSLRRSDSTRTRLERSNNIICFPQIGPTNGGSKVMRKWLDFLFPAAGPLKLSPSPGLSLFLSGSLAEVDLLNGLFIACSAVLNSTSSASLAPVFLCGVASGGVFWEIHTEIFMDRWDDFNSYLRRRSFKSSFDLLKIGKGVQEQF